MIYLDSNATTPLSVKVKELINNNLDFFCNPSSLYREGVTNKERINKARKSVAELIGANKDNIIFTGCATESNNAVFHHCVNKYKKGHILVSSVEHSAILETAKFYENNANIDVTYLPVDHLGNINLEQLKNEVREDTILVSIMLVNNEIGNIYPISEIVKLVRAKNPGAKIHTDAVQAIGKMNVDVETLGVDFLSMSAHKFYAPKGVGALYIRDPEGFIPFMKGGHQEAGRRAGTENILSIMAMGVAAQEAKEFCEYNRIKELRDYMEAKILKQVIGSKIIGDPSNRICNTSCIMINGFSGVDISEVINKVADVCISSGSACNSVELSASHVMRALGYSTIPIRISLNKYTTKDEIDNFCYALLQTLNIIRKRR